MLEPLSLDPAQQEAIDLALSTNSGGILDGSEGGTGKTLTWVEYCKQSKSKVVLLIGPLQTMGHPLDYDPITHHGWQGTFERQQIGLPFRQIDGSKNGLAAHTDLKWSVPGIYFVGQEFFVRRAKEFVMQTNRNDTPKMVMNKKTKKMEQERKKEWTTFWDVAVDTVIFDEVHRASNGQSETHKALMGMGIHGKNTPRGFKIGCSATYEGNSFDGAWAITYWLWPHLIDPSIYVWRRKWADTAYDPFAPNNEKVIGEKNPGAFVASLPAYVRIESKLDLKVIEETFYVDLPAEQRRIYDEFDEKMVAWIKDHPMVIKFPITKRIRQRQVTLGVPTVTHHGREDGEIEYQVSFDPDCESEKFDMMCQKVLEGFFDNEVSIIFTDSQSFAAAMTHKLNVRYGENSAREWSGKIKRKVRTQDKADFLAGKFKYFVMVIKASGTGTDLLHTVCRNSCWISADDSGVEMVQSKWRTFRRNSPFEFVRFAYIVARNTWDEGQASKLAQDALNQNKRLRRRK